MVGEERVNTDQWNNNYKSLIEFRIGRYFKDKAIEAAGFHNIVLDRNAGILDVGCGSGKFLISLMEKGFVNLSGIDPEKELTRGIPCKIRIVNCPVERIMFDNNSFDIVFIYGVLHHLKGRDAWMQSFKEINRVLKPKGFLFIIEPCNKFIFRILESASGVLGLGLKSFRILGELIRQEKKELYDFIDNYRIYENYIYRNNYNVIVNKRKSFVLPAVQWILTAQKP